MNQWIFIAYRMPMTLWSVLTEKNESWDIDLSTIRLQARATVFPQTRSSTHSHKIRSDEPVTNAQVLELQATPPQMQRRVAPLPEMLEPRRWVPRLQETPGLGWRSGSARAYEKPNFWRCPNSATIAKSFVTRVYISYLSRTVSPEETVDKKVRR